MHSLGSLKVTPAVFQASVSDFQYKHSYVLPEALVKPVNLMGAVLLLAKVATAVGMVTALSEAWSQYSKSNTAETGALALATE